MKAAKKLVLILLLLCMIFSLAACGSKKLSGTYELSAMLMDGEDYLPTMQELGSYLGYDTSEPFMVFRFDKNGTVTMEVGSFYALLTEEASATGSYTVKDSTVSITIQEKTLDAQLEGSTLSMLSDGVTLVFTKK